MNLFIVIVIVTICSLYCTVSLAHPCGDRFADVPRKNHELDRFAPSDEGFIVSEISPEALKRIGRYFDSVVRCANAVHKCGSDAQRAQRRQGNLREALYGIRDYQLSRCYIDSGDCRALAREPAILEAVRSAIGDDVVLWSVDPFVKSGDKAHPWHTDIEPYDRCLGRNVQIWLPIEGVDENNTLRVMSHSHQMPSVSWLFPDIAGAVELSESPIDALRQSEADFEKCAQALNPRARVVTPVVRPGQFLLMSSQMWHASLNFGSNMRRAVRLCYSTPECQIGATTHYVRPVVPPLVPIPAVPQVLHFVRASDRERRFVVNNVLFDTNPVAATGAFFDIDRVGEAVSSNSLQWNGFATETLMFDVADTVSQRYDGNDKLTVLVVTRGGGKLFHRHSADQLPELIQLTKGGVFVIRGGSFFVGAVVTNSSVLMLQIATHADASAAANVAQFRAWPPTVDVAWTVGRWQVESMPCEDSANANIAVVVPFRCNIASAWRPSLPWRTPKQCRCLAVWDSTDNANAKLGALRAPAAPQNAFPPVVNNVTLQAPPHVKWPRLMSRTGTTALHTGFFQINVGGFVASFSPHEMHTHHDDEIWILLNGNISQKFPTYTRSLVANESFVWMMHFPAGNLHTVLSHTVVRRVFVKWRSKTVHRPDAPTHETIVGTSLDTKAKQLFQCTSRYFLGAVAAHYSSLAPGEGYKPHKDGYEIVILLIDGRIRVSGREEAVLEAKYGDSVAVLHYRKGESHGLYNIGQSYAKYLVIELNKH